MPREEELLFVDGRVELGSVSCDELVVVGLPWCRGGDSVEDLDIAAAFNLRHGVSLHANTAAVHQLSVPAGASPSTAVILSLQNFVGVKQGIAWLEV